MAGGQNWGGLAYDPNNKLLVMPQNYVVSHNKLVPRDQKPAVDQEFEYQGYSPNEGTPYVVKHEVLLSPFGVPSLGE